MTTTVTKARRFAEVSHRGQMYGELPYIVHLDEVANVAEEFGFSPAFLAAAYLHDILEDTDVTMEQLEDEFDLSIATLVWKVTDEPGKNRRERHQKTYIKTKTDYWAVALKLCDRIANVRHSIATNNNLLNMYKKEYAEFRSELYVRGLWDNLWDELDRLLGV